MLLFRSEEHLARWLRKTKDQRGAVVPLEQVWRLAKAWYADPRRIDWAPRTIEQSQAVLASVGLTGDFWSFR
jgi:hypothetical protein